MCHKLYQLRSWLKSTYLLLPLNRLSPSELEPPSVTSTSHAPLPLIPFSPSFPLSPPRVLLGFLVFATHRRRSVGVLAESVENAVGDGLARFGGGGVTPGLLAAVRLVVEVAEEDDEGDGVADEGVVHPVREVAVDVEGQGRVADGDVELDLRGTTEVKSCSPTACVWKNELAGVDFWIGSVLKWAPRPGGCTCAPGSQARLSNISPSE